MRRLVLFMSLVIMLGAGHAGYKMGENGAVKKDEPKQQQRRAPSLKEMQKIKFPAPGERKEDPEDAVIADLSHTYAIGEDKIRYFRGLHHGYDEIVRALIVAKDAQVEAGRILSMRVDGKSWETITTAFFVDAKDFNKEAADVLAPIREKVPKQAMVERPQTRKE